MEGRLPFWRNPDTAPRPNHTVSIPHSSPTPYTPPLFVSLFDSQIKRTNWENGWAIERGRLRSILFHPVARENADFV